MPKYDVEVTVKLSYEVEADSIAQAEEEGWKWENYTMHSEVYAIDVDEQYHYSDEEEQEEEE